MDCLAVDYKILKTDIGNLSVRRVAADHGHFGIRTVVGNILEKYIVYAPARSIAIFVIEAHLQMQKLSLTEILRPHIFRSFCFLPGLPRISGSKVTKRGRMPI